jgi:hypothetical protein
VVLVLIRLEEEREREKEEKKQGEKEIGGRVKETGRAPDKGEQRRRSSRILQGRIRKIRELQGPNCKTKFPVDLKP